MKNKGFTLIELLAVIVILAIIALITIPIIAESISESREKSALRAAELYIDAVDQELTKKNMDGSFSLEDGCYTVNSNGNLQDSNNAEVLVVSAKNKPSSGTVCIENFGVKAVLDLKVNDKYVETKDDGSVVIASTGTKYNSGDIIYFDVVEGTSCTESEYNSSYGTYYTMSESEVYEDDDYGNSVSGYNGISNTICTSEEEGEYTCETNTKYETQNSCLKFYVLNDKGTYVDLILDHNTHTSVMWNEKNVINGPKEVINQLKKDTKDWKGVRSIPNYTIETQEEISYYIEETDEVYNGKIKYTINYSDSNARLITIDDIVEVIGESVLDDGFIREEGASTADVVKNQGWLYDRLNSYDADVIDLGVPNRAISIIEDQAYWTSNLDGNDIRSVYAVRKSGRMDSGTCYYHLGVRPVIAVSKNNL